MNDVRTEMVCEEVQALLPLVADGALGQQDDPVLFEHLARCHDCQEALVQHDLIAVALERSRQNGVRAKKRLVFRLPIPWAVAASVVLAAGVWMALAGGAPANNPAVMEQVTRITLPNGKVGYEVRRGDTVLIVNPEQLDGSGVSGNAEPVQPVTLKKRPAP